MEMLDESGVHSHLSEQAKVIARLADQVTDRRIKLHLIGMALGLLGLLEKHAEKSPPHRPV
jgi:hypothetical protein